MNYCAEAGLDFDYYVNKMIIEKPESDFFVTCLRFYPLGFSS